MHIHDVLDLAENSDTEWFHNIIANVFQVVLVDASVIPPHALTQLEPKLLIEVDAFIKSQVVIPIIPNYVFILPSPEVVRGYKIKRAKFLLIS